jgi:nucleoside-diphosphate-sugar epimerase
MVHAIQSDFRDQRAFNVAGGSTISYREMAASVFRALGKPERLVSMPPAVLGFGLAVAGKLAGIRGLNAAMAERQNVDLVFDDSEARQVFGFKPRSFDPGPADFRLPAVISSSLPHWLGTPEPRV